MKMLKRIALILIMLCCLHAWPAPSRAQTPAEQVAELMSRMSVEDKVGQLFIVPFVGANANSDADIYQLLTEYKVGGVVLLAANSNFRNDPSAPRQITELVNSLQTTALNSNGLPLFVAIDHEGDDYPFTRITQGMTPIPSQMAIGATWDVGNAEAIGQIVGEELGAMGLNMILGPSLDVLNDPRPTGRGDIGIRVYGGDPYWVGRMGRAYIRGIHQGSGGQMVTVAKHFPGHGGSDRLPDREVATVDKSLQELRRIELPPFFYATAPLADDPLGITDALMSSHIRYRGFQGDIRQFTAPISFDAEGMSTLLALPEIARWHEGGGLIVSDALGVEAVRKHFDPNLETFPHRRIAKEAFLAGNDLLILDQFALRSVWEDQFPNIKDTIFFFRTEYNNNPTFARQVDAAVARILTQKLKLYPTPSPESLNRSPDLAMEIAARPRPVVNEIAQQSLTLLYPSPEELRLRIPAPPRSNEKLLVVIDTRLARQCFTPECEMEELYLARSAIEETILRLYGPGATGQIQPEQISTITFSELKMALGGAISLEETPPEAAAPPAEPNNLILLPAEEVRQKIKEANWLIFAALDLNLSRFPDSDALKLFLAQESGALLDKTSVVLAFNAPYYLDTTEVTKLTAYYGVYSKTRPHLEAAVRALFGEIPLPGAAPVSVDGIGYRLVDVLSPNPDQEIPLTVTEVSPDNRIIPATLSVEIGPVVDYNNHLVPDDTPIEFKARLNGREIAAETAHTVEGRAQVELTVSEAGEIDLVAVAGPSLSSAPVGVTLLAPATPTPSPTTSPTATPAAAETATSAPTPEPEPTATDTPPPAAPAIEPPPVEPEPANPTFELRRLDGLDLLSALSATLLAGLLGFRLGQQFHHSLSRRVRLGLWALIGGLAAYLLYGLGWLRPEQWLLDEPGLAAGRLAVAGLAFVFGLVALGLGNRGVTAGKR